MQNPPSDETGQTLDLTNCDKEPIHIPGSVQPHGVLLVLRPENLAVLQVSENVERLFGVGAAELLNHSVESLLGVAQTGRLRDNLGRPDLGAINPLALSVAVAGVDKAFHGVIHRSGETIVLELEPVPSSGAVAPPVDTFFSFYHEVRTASSRLLGAMDLLHLCQVAVEEVRRMTGFDRVMVYRFDEDWNGRVLAEEKRASMDSYLDLYFPASDIPKQARELYRRNWLRFVVDAACQPARLVPPLDPQTRQPLDLSFSILRSVSPIHLEYLRNMGVMASMSVSILKDGELWGLIACHHATARYVPYEVRTACEFLGQVLSSQLAAREKAEAFLEAARLKHFRDELIVAMEAAFQTPEQRFMDGLLEPSVPLLDLTNASGAAVCDGAIIHLVGATPSREQIVSLLAWLKRNGHTDLLAVNDLPRHFPASEAYADRASGLLAVVSEGRGDAVLWFRPEVARTVTWAGNPRKPVSGTGADQRIHPRTSFAQWQETVRGTSLPWTDAEREAAHDLRNAITALALRGAAQELAHLNQELARRNQELDAFAYIASHDLKAPLRGITHLAGWIEEDLGEALSEESRGLLDKLNGRVRRMEGIVEGVLQYARVGRVSIKPEPVDVGVLLTDIIDLLVPAPGMVIEVGPGMPTLVTEKLRLQQVFQNLISNALKHNTKPDGHVWISVQPAPMDGFAEFAVADDGPGIEPQYHAKIFQMFQTLEARDTVENTGIGLAIIQKIVEAQGGAGDGRVGIRPGGHVPVHVVRLLSRRHAALPGRPLRLIGADVIPVLQGQPDVVQAVEQQVASERVHVKVHREALRIRHPLCFQVNSESISRRFGPRQQIADDLLGSVSGSIPFLKQLL